MIRNYNIQRHRRRIHTRKLRIKKQRGEKLQSASERKLQNMTTKDGKRLAISAKEYGLLNHKLV